MQPAQTGPPGDGWKPERTTAYVINRGAAATAGALMVFDLDNGSTDVNVTERTSLGHGALDSPLSVVILSTGAVSDYPGAIYGIATEDIGADQQGEVVIQGPVSATVGGALSAGDDLQAAVGQMAGGVTAGAKIIAKALTDVAGAGQALVYFEGLNYLGIV